MLVLSDDLFCRFGRNLIVSSDPRLKPICIMRLHRRIASHPVAVRNGCTTIPSARGYWAWEERDHSRNGGMSQPWPLAVHSPRIPRG